MPKLLWILAGLAVAAIASPALADAIDGHWCSPDGRHLAIMGSAITTPGGAQLEGHYARHNFSYVAPAGEPDAGALIRMQLAGETRVYVRVDGAGGEPQLWRRCEDVSFLVRAAPGPIAIP